MGIDFNSSKDILTFATEAPENVTLVGVVRSIVTYLMSDFCRSFPKLEIFKLQSVTLEWIDRDALTLCPNLTNFNVIGNQLRSLDENTFSTNTELRYIYLSTNNLRCVHVNLFQGLIHLKELYLSYNKLRYLDPLTFRDLKELTLLSLHSNELLEFGAPNVLSFLPKLEIIHLKYNEFKCSELVGILDVLKTRELKYDQTLTKYDCEPDDDHRNRNSCLMPPKSLSKVISARFSSNSLGDNNGTNRINGVSLFFVTFILLYCL